MLIIIVTVLPVIIPDPYITSGQMAAHVTQWIITMVNSNQLLGNTGVSMRSIRINETVVPNMETQNKVSNGCWLMYGFFFNTSTYSPRKIPCDTAALKPTISDTNTAELDTWPSVPCLLVYGVLKLLDPF